MNTYETRRHNLRRLMQERFGGKRVALAEAIERQPDYISRCLSTGKHRKRIGEDFARHIEQSLGLETGWLDRPLSDGETSDSEEQPLKDRLKALMEEKGWGENELARRSGVSQPTIHRILTGESRSPRADNLQKLAATLGTGVSHLSYGNDSCSAPQPALNVGEASQPFHYCHRYPVIRWEQAGSWSEAVAPCLPGAKPHVEATDYRAQGRAFWLEVKGDSMTAPTGVIPSIPEGTLVLFDTGIDPAPGKLVVALLTGNHEATFKRLIEDGGQRYLQALNPAYPLIPINGNCQILGVAVETKTRL